MLTAQLIICKLSADILDIILGVLEPYKVSSVLIIPCLVLPTPSQGVIEYSLALFFNKLVVFTFLYWLPFYVKASCESVQIYKDKLV